MSIPNPDHYLDQADHLIKWSGGRQVDLRRAISAAYYGIFHAVMRAAADAYIGRSNQKGADYETAYRHIDHAELRKICEKCKKDSPASDLGTFAGAVVELQARRHEADYGPALSLRSLDARTVVQTARAALNRFRNPSSDDRLKFLFMLMVRQKPRS